MALKKLKVVSIISNYNAQQKWWSIMTQWTVQHKPLWNGHHKKFDASVEANLTISAFLSLSTREHVSHIFGSLRFPIDSLILSIILSALTNSPSCSITTKNLLSLSASITSASPQMSKKSRRFNQILHQIKKFGI